MTIVKNAKPFAFLNIEGGIILSNPLTAVCCGGTKEISVKYQSRVNEESPYDLRKMRIFLKLYDILVVMILVMDYYVTLEMEMEMEMEAEVSNLRGGGGGGRDDERGEEEERGSRCRLG